MTVLTEALQKLFERDLKKLKTEIESYGEESKLWIIEKEISNSAGNLCLHLCGNLQYYIGNVLGNSGYVRDRENEFAAKNVARQELLNQLDATRTVLQKTLTNFSENDLEKVFPEKVFGYEMTTAFFLIHLSGHLNYHLGQINYHRRLFI